ncbi:MAG: hypothetical protein GY698_02470 [Actinomycetia bacterium]|nr:hypothetical protein [Actinomycetes bacterium]
MRTTIVLLVLLGAVGLSCSSTEPPSLEIERGAPPSTSGDDLWPDVLGAGVVETVPGLFRVSATLSSPYDSPERYADGWRLLGPDGTVYGERLLAHDHAGEQPFTRSVSGVEIPVEGRDQVWGWGGATLTVEVPHGTS